MPVATAHLLLKSKCQLLHQAHAPGLALLTQSLLAELTPQCLCVHLSAQGHGEPRERGTVSSMAPGAVCQGSVSQVRKPLTRSGMGWE